jgi:hypothetical protein
MKTLDGITTGRLFVDLYGAQVGGGLEATGRRSVMRRRPDSACAGWISMPRAYGDARKVLLAKGANIAIMF